MKSGGGLRERGPSQKLESKESEEVSRRGLWGWQFWGMMLDELQTSLYSIKSLQLQSGSSFEWNIMMICFCTSWTISLVILLGIWSLAFHYSNSYQKKQLSLIFIHSHSFTLCYQDHRILIIECCIVVLCYVVSMICLAALIGLPAYHIFWFSCEYLYVIICDIYQWYCINIPKTI